MTSFMSKGYLALAIVFCVCMELLAVGRPHVKMRIELPMGM